MAVYYAIATINLLHQQHRVQSPSDLSYSSLGTRLVSGSYRPNKLGIDAVEVSLCK
jgi:hypothetical protein